LADYFSRVMLKLSWLKIQLWLWRISNKILYKMRILSIDYGEKRIGLAVCDKKEVLASRFLTLENKSLEKSIKEIKKIILEENVKKIVVGIPIGFKNKSEQTKIIEKFIGKLEKNISIPIIKINEIFTSKMAKKNLREAGVKDVKKVIDQEAARIILESYLEKGN